MRYVSQLLLPDTMNGQWGERRHFLQAEKNGNVGQDESPPYVQGSAY